MRLSPSNSIPLPSHKSLGLLFICSLTLLAMSCEGPKRATRSETSVGFVAYQPAPDFPLPAIVLQYDPINQTGANWAEVSRPKWHELADPIILGRAAEYVRDGLKRMTGRDFAVVSTNDLSRGIVLTLRKNATKDIRNDPAVERALRSDPRDPYAANEAFYIRSEKERVLVVANTPDGLTDAVAELLESVNYEILGMGPNWIHVPDHRSKPLVFSVNRAGRASFYIRRLWAHSGQSHGKGTILSGLTDPADEDVTVSSWRWDIGRRLYGKSMPAYSGHALQAYHRRIMDEMRRRGSTEGFLATVKLGPESQRPPAGVDIKDLWWFNTDPPGAPGFDKIYSCDGKEWQLHLRPDYFPGCVDVSAPLVREVLFEEMKSKAEAAFAARPDDSFSFPAEPEDGGVTDAKRIRTLAHKNWYPEYLADERLPFGRPYVLHGRFGLNQPVEVWDPASASDHLYGLVNCLLHEFDKWIDSLPPERRVTATGKSKKDLIRCAILSYNYHDVPPNFNLDPRIRVQVAPFPKHRGIGKWEKIANQEDMARALRFMLPGEPSADYSFYSFSFYRDGGPTGIPVRWSASPSSIADGYRRMYAAGCRAIGREIDFNFGKYGLGYYLASQVLWNANLTAHDLDAIRDRWFQRAFGSAWREMKAYYDFMLPENYPVNSPNSWAKAIRLIDDADRKLDGTSEPDAQRRIDDVKQYWYCHYLFDSGQYTTNSPAVKEFLWKGQMSYMVGMQGLVSREFKTHDVKAVVGPEISAGPAHYTHTETQAWWAKVLECWKVTPVVLFAESTLADGQPAKNVDLNDLVMVKEFQTGTPDAPFLYNSGYMKPGTFLMLAGKKGDPLGFKLVWPFNPNDNHYIARKVSYGVDTWDPVRKTWLPWEDETMTTQASVEMTGSKGDPIQVVDVQLKAPRPGVYRFAIGTGGNLARLAGPTYDPATGTYGKPVGFTYYTQAEGLTQGPAYFYIPKGTRTLDLEVWDTANKKSVTLHKDRLSVSRKVDIGAMGVHTIALQPGEDGSIAAVEGNKFHFPFLYSVPTLWAKSPAALLVPRGIAEADGLAIITAASAGHAKGSQ